MTFAHEVDVRFRDLDTLGHVNNALYATYLEEARVAYYRDVVGVALESADTVVVSLEIEFRHPIDLEDPVTVTLEVPELGASSVPMAYEIEAGGERAATAETVQVVWDPDAGESAPIPEDWRAAIEAHEGR